MNNFNLNTPTSKYKQLYIACVCLMLIGLVTFMKLTNNNANQLSKTGYYFDTKIDITIYGLPTKSANTILDKAMDLCSYYEHLFSKTLEDTDIYRINTSNGSPTFVDAETINLISLACQYSEESNGIVDPSVGLLTDLWHITEEDFNLPSNEEINKAKEHINYNNILIDDANKTITLLDPQMKLDLGFIAKGYIADKLKELLISEGVSSALINLGGNILCINTKPDGSNFNIGVNDPKKPYENAIKTLSINNKSVVSSGDYERCVTIDDKLYHHIISIKNGYPAESNLSQVTIISDSSVEGDALSTICFILGSEEAKKYLSDNHPNIEAIFVDSSGQIIQ